MPVQINELIIRATVEPETNNQHTAGNVSINPRDHATFEDEIAEIIFEILKEKKER